MSLVVDSSKQVERAAEEIGTCLELTLGNPDLGGGLHRSQTVVPPRVCEGAQIFAEGHVKGHGGLRRTILEGGPDPSREVSSNPRHTLQGQ